MKNSTHFFPPEPKKKNVILYLLTNYQNKIREIFMTQMWFDEQLNTINTYS